MTPLATTDASDAAPPGYPPAGRPGLARRVLGLAWPVLALNSLVLLVDLSDRFLVGNLPGVAAGQAQSMLAAQGTAHYVAWFISSYTVLVSVGATALVARCVGAGDRATANRATHQAIVLAAAVGLLGSAAALLTLPEFVGLLGLGGADWVVNR